MEVKFEEDGPNHLIIDVVESVDDLKYIAHCVFRKIGSVAYDLLAATNRTNHTELSPHPLVMVKVIRKLLDTLIELGCQRVDFHSSPLFTPFHLSLIKEYGWVVKTNCEGSVSRFITATKPELEVAK